MSTRGNDSLDGLAEEKLTNKSGPFATLHRARDEVRRLRAAGYTGAVTVLIRGGIYFLSEPLVFKPQDSGLEGKPVTYAAYPGETPVISGAFRVSNWTTYGGKAIATLGPGVAPFRQLFVNGIRKYRPRFPKDGFYRIADVPGVDANTPLLTPVNQFYFFPGDLSAAWKNLDDVEVEIFYYFMNPVMNIDTIDEQERLVTFKQSTEFRLTDGLYVAPNGPRYYVDNVYEAMGPGNWYFDRHSHELMYTPEAGEDELVADIPQLQSVVKFVGDVAKGRFVEHIILRGLTFSHTESLIPTWAVAGEAFGACYVPGAVDLTGARNITIERNTFSHLGTYGIQLGPDTQNVLVRRNEFLDLGAGGIKIFDENPNCSLSYKGSSFGHVLRDNRIVDGGRVFHEAAGILVGNTGPNVITHNEVANVYSNGISLGWAMGYLKSFSNRSTITYNNVHHIGQSGWMSDLGAIYVDGISQGTRVAKNVIHDVESGRYGGYGLYADGGASGVTFEQNIVYRTQDAAFHLHYGLGNVVRNNIFYDGRDYQLRHSSQEGQTSLTFNQNMIVYKTGLLHFGFWDDPSVQADRNIYFKTEGQPLFGEHQVTFAAWQAGGKDVNSFVLNPEFRDPDHGDFTMQREDIGSLIGFQEIPAERVGPTDESSTCSTSHLTADSVTPSSGSGASQTFSFQYSNADGFAEINNAQVIIHSGVTYQAGCVAYYARSSQGLYLHQDSGPAWDGPIPIGTAGTLQNSQCSIDVGSSSASGSVNSVTVNLATTFKPAFTGSKNVYGFVQDNAALTSGWQLLGTWNPTNSSPPVAVSVTPNAGSGASQTFTFQYSDPGGFADINNVQAIINSGVTYQAGCVAYYSRSTQGLYLHQDSGPAWDGPIPIGTAGTLQNSQCSIDVGSSSASGSVNSLTVNLATTFKPAFTGSKNVYGFVQDNAALASGWQTLGTWTAP